MTVYVVTSFNYNNPFFWASITSTGPHTLDFSGLPAGWLAEMDSDTNQIGIWNGFSWYTIGESGDFTTSTTLSAGVSFEIFTGFIGTSGDDYREGSQGDDIMTGGAGADTLSGDDGVDTISGGTGADYLTGGQDADTIHGGDGDDTIRGDNMWFETTDHASGSSGSPTTLTVTNNADGPIELWWIDGTGTQVYYATLQPGDTHVQNTFTDHNWVLRDENGYYLELIEGGANQTVVYGDQPLGDTLHGDAGNDTIFGEFGDDWIDGGADNDMIDGGYGNDTLLGGTGGDTIYGGEGDDTIDGGDGADVIYGDSTTPANVTINTSNYTDTSSGYTVTAQNVVGGTLTAPSLANVSVFGGGLGANGSVAFVDSGTQSQIAYDTATGLSEALVVDFDAPISDLSFSFDLLPTQDFLETGHWAIYNDGVLVAEADFSEDVPGSRSGTVDVSGHGAFDQIVFTANIQSDLSAGSDFVITSITYTPAPTEPATGGNDIITGGAGDDVIHGEAGDDWIDGGADNDTIDGGAGNDTLIGGTGNDTIFGDSVIAADQMVNGDLSSGTGWTLTGAAGGIAGGRHLVGGDYGNSTLTYDTPLTDLQSGPSANGTGEVRFDLAWSDGNPASTSGYSILEMRIDGVVYARITTPNGDGSSATVTYLNGASGSPASLSEGDAINGNGYTTLTVDLPLTVPDSGTLSFVTDTTNGTDDFSLDNVEVVTFAPVGGGADTIHGGEGDDLLVGDDLTATGPNLIVNGSFEDTTGMTPDFFGYSASGSITGWTSADPGHAIHVHNDGRGGLPATDGANWLDLEGHVGQQLTISQDVTGVANGSAYILSFDVGDIADGNDGTALDNTLTVIWNGEVIATIDPADGVMESYEFVVIGGSGDGTDRLTFVSGGNDDHHGVSLDNVSLQLATSTLGGDDTFVMEDGFGNDTVIGGELGETNGDTIDLSAVTSGLTVTYAGDEAGTITDGTDTITFSEVENLILSDQADVVLANADTAGVNIDAGGGDDTISGGAGNDTIYGGAGQDTIIGRAGDDVIHGGDARDIIDGGDGADIIHGDAGDDDLDGNAGDDVIYGGDGNDLIHVDEGEGNDIIFGGEGGETVATADVLNINNLSVTNVTLTGNEAGTAVFGGTTVTFSEIETIYLDTVVATDDTMDASVATTGIRFGGGAGNDTLIGGAGDDFLWGYTGDDMLLGGDGNDTLQGDTGNDTLMGGAGDDLLNAGAGDDTIYSGSGNDIVSGGDGADIAVVEHTDGVDTIDLGDGDAATDILNFAYLSPVGVDMAFTWGDSGTYAFLGGGGASGTFAGVEQVNLTQNDDIADASGAADEVIIFGGEGDDILTGGAGSDRLEGGAGDDVIDGGGGPTGTAVGDGATVTGTNGENHFVWSGGANATSTIILDDGSGTANDADTASDVIYVSDTGDNATLTVEGFTYGQDKILVAEQWAGINAVQVAPGHNLVTLTYASGDAQVFDIHHDGTGMFLSSDVFAVHGVDLLSGGDGDDTFLVSDGFGNDTIIGGELGETNGDTIDLSAVTAPLTVTYTGDETGAITDGTDTITFTEVENLILSDQADVVDASADTAGVNIDAGVGDDDITGGSGADTIDAGDGNDDINAGAGDDTIIAGDGNDYIAQWDNYGNDTVDGGAGVDWLDFFWVSTHAVNVTFDDPTGGTVTGGGYTVNFDNIEDFGLTDQSDTLDASLSGSDMMIFGYHGDDTIIAGAGNDFISGDEGSDTLTGGAGNDTFFYSMGDGADTITDFNTGNTGTLGDGDSTNNDYIDLSAFYDSLWELWADQADDGVLNQSNATDLSGNAVDYSDNTQFAPGDSLTFTGATADNAFFTAENTGVACFTAGTLIETPGGPRPVESLEPGDLVTVLGGAPLPVMWAGQTSVGAAKLARRPWLRPIRIRKGALGNCRDLLVSPQHRVALGSAQAPDGFVPARWLAEDADGRFRIANGRSKVTYVHVLLPRHAVIIAEGMASESFYPGPHALAGLDPVARESLFLVYPAFAGIRSRDDAERLYGPLALPRLARAQLPRHLEDHGTRPRADNALPHTASA